MTSLMTLQVNSYLPVDVVCIVCGGLLWWLAVGRQFLKNVLSSVIFTFVYKTSILLSHSLSDQTDRVQQADHVRQTDRVQQCFWCLTFTFLHQQRILNIYCQVFYGIVGAEYAGAAQAKIFGVYAPTKLRCVVCTEVGIISSRKWCGESDGASWAPRHGPGQNSGQKRILAYFEGHRTLPSQFVWPNWPRPADWPCPTVLLMPYFYISRGYWIYTVKYFMGLRGAEYAGGQL